MTEEERVRVRLPDHDFNVGSKHLLIPSVLAHCKIDPLTGKVSYSGETYIGIRSSKHNNSSAYSHNDDLQTFIKHNPGVFLSPGSAVEVKPVLVKGTDGGPDENPRFEKNIIMGCKTFQVLLFAVLNPVVFLFETFSTLVTFVCCFSIF